MAKQLTWTLVCAVCASLVFGVAGCTRQSTDESTGTQSRRVSSEQKVRSGLSELLGERFGRAQVGRNDIHAELAGDARDSDFAGALLLLLPTRSDGASLSVAFLDPSASWRRSEVTWNPESGRMILMHGNGAEFLVLPPPADGAYEWAEEDVWDGGVASGVDKAALERYASGEPVPWDPSVR